MKYLAYLLPLALLLLPVRADDSNLIQNGDFSDGINHWYGGGRSPADYSSDNPMAASDPLTSKGLIIPLHAETWTKVAQDFKGKSDTGELTITFQVSPDFAFSAKDEDYKNMPDKIGYDGWRAFDTKVGTWVVFVSDFGSSKGTYCMIKAEPGQTGVKTFHTTIKNLTPFEDKTMTLAFPPGTGMIVITSVSFTGQ
jgi:hypothetical protein